MPLRLWWLSLSIGRAHLKVQLLPVLVSPCSQLFLCVQTQSYVQMHASVQTQMYVQTHLHLSPKEGWCVNLGGTVVYHCCIALLRKLLWNAIPACSVDLMPLWPSEWTYTCDLLLQSLSNALTNLLDISAQLLCMRCMFLSFCARPVWSDADNVMQIAHCLFLHQCLGFSGTERWLTFWCRVCAG